MGWSLVGTASTAGVGAVTSITINVPTGTLNGDLMVLTIGFKLNASFVNGAAGWSSLAGLSGQQSMVRVASSEPANYNFSMNAGSTIMVGAISTFRGADAHVALPIDANYGSGSGTTPAVFGGIDFDQTINAQRILSGGLSYSYVVGRFTSGASVTWPSSGYTSITNLADSSGQVVLVTQYVTNILSGVQTPASVAIPTLNQTAWGTGHFAFQRFRSNQLIA